MSAEDKGKSPSPSISETAGQLRPVACLRCRQRRSFCSKEKPQCARCRDGGHDCTYEEARKITINEAYLRDLEAKVKAYEDFAPPPPLSSVPGPSRGGNSGGEEEEDVDAEQLLEPFTRVGIDPSSGRQWTRIVQPASADNYLERVRRSHGLPHDDGRSVVDPNPGLYEQSALRSRRRGIRNPIRLPPIEIARRLFAAQYTYIGTIFFFTDPEHFETLLQEAYQGPPDPADREACLAYAKVLMILAFGQLYSINQWVDYSGPPGFGMFSAALELLPDMHEDGSILCVETLAYVGYFMQNMDRKDAAFLYIGNALRMAVSLGLHQETNLPSVDEITREHRRRVWWSIYSLDRILCVKSGNPLTIADEDIAVAMPSRLVGEPEYCPAVVLRHYTELSRILGEVMSRIYRRTPTSGSRLMASVKAIIRALGRWRAEIPPELAFDPARLAITRESVSTFLHYFQCINMTARPLLFHVVQQRLRVPPAERQRDWRVGLSATTASVIDACVSAAQETVHMMTVAAQRDLVATYGYMDSEHAFSAAIVLVMVCGAFPANAHNTAAMNAGMALLKAMGQRGNSAMGQRYELLAHLKRVLMPGVPEDDGVDLGVFSSPGPSGPPGGGTGMFQAGTQRTGSQGDIVRGPNLGPAPVPTPSNWPNVDPLLFGGGDWAHFPTGEDMDQLIVDVNMGVAGDDDLGLWAASFANPTGFDLTQWTHAAEMAVDQDQDDDQDLYDPEPEQEL